MTSSNSQTLAPELQSWFNRGSVRNLVGKDIYVIDEGNAEQAIIVVIHGFPTSSWDFEKIWPELRKAHRVISLDMHGFGFSSKPNKRDYTIHQQADLFESLLAELQVGKFHILAHDYGVSVAQELLARQANQELTGECVSCCFLNGGLFPETHKALLIQKLLLGPLGPLINRFTGFKQFASSFSRVFGEETKPTEQELKLFWQVINLNHGRHLFHNLITYMRDRRLHRERWLNALQQASVPLALINGSVDPVSGAHLVDRYQELNCRLDYLKQLHAIGHYPQTEDPESVASAYLEFLATCT